MESSNESRQTEAAEARRAELRGLSGPSFGGPRPGSVTAIGWTMTAGGLLAATAIGFVAASFFVRLTPLEVANDIDVSLGLRERVSSALALDRSKVSSAARRFP